MDLNVSEQLSTGVVFHGQVAASGISLFSDNPEGKWSILPSECVQFSPCVSPAPASAFHSLSAAVPLGWAPPNQQVAQQGNCCSKGRQPAEPTAHIYVRESL